MSVIFLCFRNLNMIMEELVHIIQDEESVSYYTHHMCHDMRKPVFGVSDQVQHKLACAATEVC